MGIQKIVSGCMIFLCILHSKGQTVFPDGAKYGLMDAENKVILSATYDTIADLKKNPLSGYNDLFILREENNYSFALKQYWETCESSSYGLNCTRDSVKWFISDHTFDTLFLISGDISDRVILKYNGYDNEKWGSKIPLSQSRSYFVLGYRKGNLSGIITYEFNLRETERKHRPGNGTSRDYDYSKTIHSVGNVVIHQGKYDRVIPSGEKRSIVTVKQNNYGIIRMADGYEIEPQFDTVPVQLTEHFFYCRKNGLWGVCFLQEREAIPLEVVPYQYTDILTIKKDCRVLFLFTQERGEKYPACVYTTTENTLLQLKFIINRLYFGQTGKEYSLPEIKYINLIPQIKGKQIIQQKDYEYLFTLTTRMSYFDKPPIFFLIKTVRENQNGFYNNDNSFNLWLREEDAKERRKQRAVVTYRLENDTFSVMHEFSDETENSTYEIIDYRDSYQDITFILKSTHLENGNYKHEFFTCDGVKTYETLSAYPINYWDLQIRKESRNNYEPNRFALKFYTEILGKKGKLEKISCYYDATSGKFSK